MSQSAAWGPNPQLHPFTNSPHLLQPWAHATSSSNMPITHGEMTAEREFYTWREAALQASEVAGLFSTASKPRVRWRNDRWLLTYTYRPVLMNGATE